MPYLRILVTYPALHFGGWAKGYHEMCFSNELDMNAASDMFTVWDETRQWWNCADLRSENIASKINKT